MFASEGAAKFAMQGGYLAGFWYGDGLLAVGGPDLIRELLGEGTVDIDGRAIAASERLAAVRFPVTKAVRSASVPFVTRSAGGPFPDPSSGSPTSGTGLVRHVQPISEFIAVRTAWPAGAEVVLLP